jgi:hypothetical protein
LIGRNGDGLSNSDDRSGGVFMGVLITFGSVVIATAAALFARILQNAVDIHAPMFTFFGASLRLLLWYESTMQAQHRTLNSP